MSKPRGNGGGDTPYSTVNHRVKRNSRNLTAEGKKVAEAQGLSVWVSDGMMVDEAFIARATQILALHEKSLDDPKE